MTERLDLTLGFSPCPNDTYIFNGLVHNRVALTGWRPAEVYLEDVETLNEWAMQGRLDITKLSFHAFGHVQDQYALLQAGAALGRGCGPLLVAGSGAKSADPANWTIAIPGAYTTAALLLRLYRPECKRLAVMRFDQIMAAVAQGTVDCGVIIHESRFTYQQMGLRCLCDLGQWWEESTGLPIPLGCIAARKTVPSTVRAEIDAAIAASIRWAEEHPGEGEAYIRAHAQEMDPQVMAAHIGLYVNDYSRGLGDDGMGAVRELLRRGVAAGVFPETVKAL